MIDRHNNLKTKLMLNFKAHKFIWIMSIVFIFFGVMEIVNGRFNLHDFEVDYTAAKNLISGQPVYGLSFGLDSGIYKYSPFTLFFILPYTFMPFFMAKTAHFFFVAVMMIYTVIYLERFICEIFFDNLNSARNKILFISVLVVGIHFNRELHLGNWNVHLLILAIFALRLIIRKKEYAAGAILAWVILMKPHFVILLPLLLMRKKIKPFASVMAGIVFGLTFPALFLGIRQNFELHMAWFKTMLNHNGAFARDESCLFSIFYNLGIKYLYPEAGILYTSVLVFSVAILVMLLVMNNLRYEHFQRLQEDKGEPDFIFEYFLLLAILPSITITDSQHYLWSLPIIIFIITYWVYGAMKRNWTFYFTMVSFLFYGGNIYELWGRDLSVWMEKAGVVGIGNILIIVSSLFIFYRMRKFKYQ